MCVCVCVCVSPYALSFVSRSCVLQRTLDIWNSFLSPERSNHHCSPMSIVLCYYWACNYNIKVVGPKKSSLFRGGIIDVISFCFVLFGAAAQRGTWPPYFWGFLITHNDAPQSVGLLWTSDQLVAENSTWQHINTHNRQTSMPPGGIRTHDLGKRAAADLRLRPRGYWDRQMELVFS